MLTTASLNIQNMDACSQRRVWFARLLYWLAGGLFDASCLHSALPKEIFRKIVSPIKTTIPFSIIVVGSKLIGKTNLLQTSLRQIDSNHEKITCWQQLPLEDGLDVTFADKTSSSYEGTIPSLQDFYEGSSVVLLCFSIRDLDSFSDITTRKINYHSEASIGLGWNGQANHFSPGAAKILVGLKEDLREEGKKIGGDVVPYTEIDTLAREIGAKGWFCVSSKTGKNTEGMFEKVREFGRQVEIQKGILRDLDGRREPVSTPCLLQ